ncbi:MAG: DUF2189 domain-containing protein [Cohaesibacter sp.]|nr:DUF2189 domain-containing protein [Cohaesibacter sp.]
MSETIDSAALSTEQETAARPKIKPIIKDISTEDISAALSAGLRDFQQNFRFGLFFGLFYALGGWMMFWFLTGLELPYLVYPLASGFALIAPFVAAGLYEVSRRTEMGEALEWRSILGAIFSKRGKELRWMAIVTGFAFIIWIDIAIFLYVIFFGLQEINISDLLGVVIGTPEGALFLTVGNVTGAILGMAVFSITVVAFPMLLHKDVDFVTGMITSVQAVLKNPKTMISWAAFIALMLAISLASFFVGMVVILPLLGHSTWHLYRRTVTFED